MEAFNSGNWRDLDDGRWVCYSRDVTIRTEPFAISALEISESDLDITIENQKIEGLSVLKSKLGGSILNCTFEGCTFEHVSFHSELDNVQFKNCTFKWGYFAPTVKEDPPDLETCTFEGCRVEFKTNSAQEYGGNPDLGAWLDY